jgi:hypothetical protein
MQLLCRRGIARPPPMSRRRQLKHSSLRSGRTRAWPSSDCPVRVWQAVAEGDIGRGAAQTVLCNSRWPRV